MSRYTASVEALRPGDPIDVVAPSSAFERERFERGIGALRQIGLLPRFASELKRFPRKLLVGYSDATVLHELWRRKGMPSIHGPMCTQLGEDPSALERLRTLLFDEPIGPLSWTSRSAHGGRAEGPLAGGNLATLGSMCGTPVQPQFRGCIVLIEDLNEPPYRLDRLLTQLALSGALDGAKAFVVGDLTAPGEDPQGREEVVAERLGKLAVPVV